MSTTTQPQSPAPSTPYTPTTPSSFVYSPFTPSIADEDDKKKKREFNIVNTKDEKIKSQLLHSIQQIACSDDPVKTAIQQLLGCPPPEPPPTVGKGLVKQVAEAGRNAGYLGANPAS